MAPKRPNSARQTAAGDIVVTRVSGHYHISRAQGAGKPFAPIEAKNRRADAIARACELAAGDHRVFLYASGSATDCVEIDCAKPQ